MREYAGRMSKKTFGTVEICLGAVALLMANLGDTDEFKVRETRAIDDGC